MIEPMITSKVESLQPMDLYQVRSESNEALNDANLQMITCAKSHHSIECFDFGHFGELGGERMSNWRLLEREKEAQL